MGQTGRMMFYIYCPKMEDILQIVSKESILFTFVVDPGRNGRNSTHGIILRNWAEIFQNAGSVSIYKISM